MTPQEYADMIEKNNKKAMLDMWWNNNIIISLLKEYHVPDDAVGINLLLMTSALWWKWFLDKDTNISYHEYWTINQTAWHKFTTNNK